MKYWLYILFFAFFASSFFVSSCFAQNDTIQKEKIKKTATANDATVLHVRSIVLKGNKITKDYVLLREMSLQNGDTVHLSNLPSRLQRSEQLLMNTSLFNWAKIAVDMENWRKDSIDLYVEVDEAMYFYPVPLADLADRNFEEWWNRQNHALWRVNWQLKLMHYNLTGNNDRLTGNFQIGYSEKAYLNYRTPYLNKSQTIRATIGAFYARNREVQTRTRGSRQIFLRNDDAYPLQRWRASTEFSYRPRNDFNIAHTLSIGYLNHRITETVRDSNAAFFNGELQQQFVTANYGISHDTRDVRPYPYKGHSFWANLTYDGFLGDAGSPKQITAEASFFQYFHTGDKLSYELGVRGFSTLWSARRVPFYNIDGLGYGTAYVRGYDGYVQDGQNWVLGKASARYKFLDFTHDWGKMMFIKQIRKMPTRAYFTLSSDAAYVQDFYYTQSNPLVNRVIYGGGPGLDIRIYFENTFSIEYLFNHLGEKNLFVRVKTAF